MRNSLSLKQNLKDELEFSKNYLVLFGAQPLEWSIAYIFLKWLLRKVPIYTKSHSYKCTCLAVSYVKSQPLAVIKQPKSFPVYQAGRFLVIGDQGPREVYSRDGSP